MRSRLVKWQLVAFALIAVLGVVYVGARYVRLDNLVGQGQYRVYADFKDSGGIFTNAEVSYRGVPVGRVGELTLTSAGVKAELKLDNGGPQIPAGTKAVVANRSAIGEQYIDLQPEVASAPFLADGSHIDQSNTSIPIPVENLLASVDTLAQSVPLAELNTTVSELGKAFVGNESNLKTLVDSLLNLADSGNQVLPETIELINVGQPVLATQSEQSPSIRSFSQNLNLITSQLVASDPDIRRIIGTGTAASDELSKLVDQSGAALTTNLTNTADVLQVVAPRALSIQALVQFLPALSYGQFSPAPGDGTIHFGLVLETNNPVPCTVGYEGTQALLAQAKAADPNFDDEYQEIPFNKDASCNTPLGSPVGVRSANRAQWADPLVVQPWDSKPKVDPDKLNLTPIAQQMAILMGLMPTTPR
ncbi:MAG: MCE family protein [Mycobacteriaceae bacterium]